MTFHSVQNASVGITEVELDAQHDFSSPMATAVRVAEEPGKVAERLKALCGLYQVPFS